MSQMNAEQLLIFRALILAEQGRAWAAVDGAVIQRMHEWIVLGGNE